MLHRNIIIISFFYTKKDNFPNANFAFLTKSFHQSFGYLFINQSSCCIHIKWPIVIVCIYTQVGMHKCAFSLITDPLGTPLYVVSDTFFFDSSLAIILRINFVLLDLNDWQAKIWFGKYKLLGNIF